MHPFFCICPPNPPLFKSYSSRLQICLLIAKKVQKTDFTKQKLHVLLYIEFHSLRECYLMAKLTCMFPMSSPKSVSPRMAMAMAKFISHTKVLVKRFCPRELQNVTEIG